MSTLTIQLEDSILGKITSFARRHGRSAEEVVAKVATEGFSTIEAMEGFEALQREAASQLTPERIKAAFDEIRSLNAPPLAGDEMPQL